MSHRRTDRSQVESPAIRLLDALRAGDDAGVLAVCGDTTVVTAENMRWSCLGREEIHDWLQVARNRFPGLTFESSTRHIGFGLVIDEARVRDVAWTEEEAATGRDGSTEPTGGHVDRSAAEQPEVSHNGQSDHPMWDEPGTEERNIMQLWRELDEGDPPPIALNLPVRVTVRHDDLQVHDVSLSFPAALLKRAMGMRVDPLEMSLSQVQSAFIAPVGAGFTTHTLERPELAVAPEQPVDEPVREPADPEPPRRRRRRWLVPVLLVLVLLGAGGAWWAVQGRTATPSAGPEPSPSPSALVSSTPSPSALVSSTPSPSASVTPSTQQSDAPTRKPNVTLRSDLAFAINSATLSAKAKQAIAAVATQVRRAGLSGTIFVDGYTDSTGSAAYGKDLSQRRAAAVAAYLTSHLGQAKVQVIPVGHGEADPIASNATAAGRQANRRVTITLPQP